VEKTPFSNAKGFFYLSPAPPGSGFSMQKKIIALAVAGLVSGAAFAQTNVTVYGVADIGYNYAKSGDNKFSGIQDGGNVGLQGSRLGFRGEEALGNGLKAIFTVEFGLELDNGQGTGLRNNRQSFVGLAGSFGSVTFGRQYAPSGAGYLGATSSNGITSVNPSNYYVGASEQEVKLDMLDGSTKVGTLRVAGMPGFQTMNTGNGSRWDNSIAYDSPNWSGFQLRAIYSFGDQVRDSAGDASKDKSKFGLGVKYINGPLYLTAMYQAVLKDSAAESTRNYLGTYVDAEGKGSNKAWAIGGSYDFKVVKVFANYIREKDDYAGMYSIVTPVSATSIPGCTSTTSGCALTRDSLKKTYWSLGVSVPVSTAGVVKAEYARLKTDVNETRSQGFSVGYEHSLSKRTTLYTYVARITNQDAIGTTIRRGDAKVGVYGENQTAFAAGINHKF
jgi:predicted porin